MSEDDPRITESNATDRDRELYEKSEDLRTYSYALRQEARDLCRYSKELRTTIGLIAANNSCGNAIRNRDQIRAILSHLELRPPINFSIDVSLRGFERNSNERLKVVDRKKVLTKSHRSK